MFNLLDEKYIEYLGSQLIIDDTTNGKTYVCTLDRGRYDSESDIPIESQECWRIKRIAETTNGTVKETRIMYPNGSNRFLFAASQATTYTYNYPI